MQEALAAQFAEAEERWKNIADDNDRSYCIMRDALARLRPLAPNEQQRRASAPTLECQRCAEWEDIGRSIELAALHDPVADGTNDAPVDIPWPIVNRVQALLSTASVRASRPNLDPPWVLFLDKGQPFSIMPAGRPGEVCSVLGWSREDAQRLVDAANRSASALSEQMQQNGDAATIANLQLMLRSTQYENEELRTALHHFERESTPEQETGSTPTPQTRADEYFRIIEMQTKDIVALRAEVAKLRSDNEAHTTCNCEWTRTKLNPKCPDHAEPVQETGSASVGALHYPTALDVLRLAVEAHLDIATSMDHDVADWCESVGPLTEALDEVRAGLGMSPYDEDSDCASPAAKLHPGSAGSFVEDANPPQNSRPHVAAREGEETASTPSSPLERIRTFIMRWSGSPSRDPLMRSQLDSLLAEVRRETISLCIERLQFDDEVSSVLTLGELRSALTKGFEPDGR